MHARHWRHTQIARVARLSCVGPAHPPWCTAPAGGSPHGFNPHHDSVNIIYAVIGPAAYGDAAGGRRVTESVISAGADMIFGQGNGSSFGMIQAVETTPAPDGGKVFFIDVIGDKSSLDKGHLLTSVLWNMVPVYSAMVEDLKNGSFGSNRYQIKLDDDSVQLLKTDHIPADAWSELMAMRDQIIDGSIEVDVIFDAQDVRALMNKVDAAE